MLYAARSALFLGWLAFILIAISFIVHFFNRNKYNELLNRYENAGYSWPGYYYFNRTMGFFGLLPMIYYFRCLQKGKRPCHTDFSSDNELYSFVKKLPPQLTQWMRAPFYMLVAAMICMLCFFAIGIVAKLFLEVR